MSKQNTIPDYIIKENSHFWNENKLQNKQAVNAFLALHLEMKGGMSWVSKQGPRLF